MRVFILNGPPSIGKDTLANAIAANLNYPVSMFKTALYKETADFYGVPLEYMIDVATGRDTKEVPNIDFNLLSPREALIHTSEGIIKPKYGKKFFGLKAVEYLQTLDGLTGSVVFSDGGFAEECECLVEHGYDVHIVQLHHPNFNFDRDSRNYVTVPGATVHRINIQRGKPAVGLFDFIEITENLNQ